ncbi:hypothetical protein [Granulicella sp. S156]|uniref:hypothetical protein n=1 Tax=Granulicella sp. S156 TaxID=1747224 RepID=UPI00131DD551|nr:hypothetical protein [Granulicella sp. S156]
MMRRPAGVVFSAIVLGLAAAMLCLLAGFSVLGAIIMRHTPMTIEAPGVPQSSSFMLGVMAFSVLLYLALAVWAITTVVGLFRMRNWARISIMVIGGGIALIGLFSMLVCAAMPAMMKSLPMPPNTNPAVLRGTFLFMAIVWLVIASIGIWWLVYFALRRTREAFAQAALQRGLPLSGTGRIPAYPATSSPMTDFTVARPMVYEPPPLPVETYLPPIAATQPAAPARPVSITIIAVLMLLGTATTVFMMLLPIPAFFFGVVLPGWTGHVLYLVFACLSGVAGVGLLKLQKPAWVLSFALYGLGLLSVLSMALPGIRHRLLDYQQNLSHTMGMGMPAPVFNTSIMNFFLLYGMAFDVLVFVFLMVLLWRARWAFESRSPAQGI